MLLMLCFLSRPVPAESYVPVASASVSEKGYSSQTYQQQQARLLYVKAIIKQYHSCIEFYDVNDAVARLMGMLQEQDEILWHKTKLTSEKMIKALRQSKAVNISRLDGIKTILNGIEFNRLKCNAARRLEEEYRLNHGEQTGFLSAGQYSRKQYETVLQTFQQHLEVQFDVINQLPGN